MRTRDIAQSREDLLKLGRSDEEWGTLPAYERMERASTWYCVEARIDSYWQAEASVLESLPNEQLARPLAGVALHNTAL